jgi:hypothetical protein
MNWTRYAPLSKVCLLSQRGQWPRLPSKSVIPLFFPYTMDTFKSPHINYATGRTAKKCVWFPAEPREFSPLRLAHPAFYSVSLGGCYPWIKRLGREADLSPHLVRLLRMSGVPPLLFVMPACCAQRTLYLEGRALFSQLIFKEIILTMSQCMFETACSK